MSDENEKQAKAAGIETGKSPMAEPSSPANDMPANDMPEDVVTPVDGEIDLARLAPQLRGLYRELLAEPIPDRFTKLLDELASKETNGQ
jgi:Anti-sigma factor NepR